MDLINSSKTQPVRSNHNDDHLPCPPFISLQEASSQRLPSTKMTNDMQERFSDLSAFGIVPDFQNGMQSSQNNVLQYKSQIEQLIGNVEESLTPTHNKSSTYINSPKIASDSYNTSTINFKKDFGSSKNAPSSDLQPLPNSQTQLDGNSMQGVLHSHNMVDSTLPPQFQSLYNASTIQSLQLLSSPKEGDVETLSVSDDLVNRFLNSATLTRTVASNLTQRDALSFALTLPTIYGHLNKQWWSTVFSEDLDSLRKISAWTFFWPESNGQCQLCLRIERLVLHEPSKAQVCLECMQSPCFRLLKFGTAIQLFDIESEAAAAILQYIPTVQDEVKGDCYYWILHIEWLEMQCIHYKRAFKCTPKYQQKTQRQALAVRKSKTMKQSKGDATSFTNNLDSNSPIVEDFAIPDPNYQILLNEKSYLNDSMNTQNISSAMERISPSTSRIEDILEIKRSVRKEYLEKEIYNSNARLKDDCKIPEMLLNGNWNEMQKIGVGIDDFKAMTRWLIEQGLALPQNVQDIDNYSTDIASKSIQGHLNDSGLSILSNISELVSNRRQDVQDDEAPLA